MLVSSVVIHVITISFIKRYKKNLTSKILQDEDGTNPHKARYNKAIVTLKSLSAWLLFYVFGLFLLFIFSRARRKYRVNFILALELSGLWKIISYKDTHLFRPTYCSPCFTTFVLLCL